jgi:sensor c-di-GMP phosphodiesterase-like protein
MTYKRVMPSQASLNKRKGASNTSGGFKLPPPKTAPREVVEEPESLETFKEKNPGASEIAIQAHEASIEAWERWRDYQAMKNEVEEMGNRVNGNLTIFDGQNISNKDEAASDWVGEMRMVIETDADTDSRRAAYECR